MSAAHPRLMLLVPNLEFGGTERQVALLALTLRRQGHDISIATFHPGGPFANELREAGVRLFALEGRGALGPLRALKNLVALLRQQRIQVLYSFLPPANVLASLAAMRVEGCRVVWSVRSADMPLDGYGMKTLLAYRFERRMARRPAHIIVNSNGGREACLRKGFPAARLTVVHNGFDTDLFKPDAEARRCVRAELGFSDGEVVIGLPARMDPVKDHDTFLRAAASLGSSRDDVRFVCIGGAGPPGYAQRLRALAGTLGIADRVTWTGNRKDMPAVLNALDIATLCSVSEGFPNTVGEAMATGVPCVVTDVGDAAFLVVRPDCVVRKRDPAALAQAWGRLLDPGVRRVVGEAARRRIVDHFSLERLADATLAVLAGRP